MRSVSEAERRETEYLLEKDEDELYMLLAQADPAYGEVMFAPSEARLKGKESFNRWTKPVYSKICGEWDYCKKQYTPAFGDTVTLVCAVADVIVTVVGGIPATIIAAILVKKGLGKFCRCS